MNDIPAGPDDHEGRALGAEEEKEAPKRKRRRIGGVPQHNITATTTTPQLH